MNLRVLVTTDWGTMDVQYQNENGEKRLLLQHREALVQF